MTPYQDPVRVHDCVQSVGDGEDSALRELLPYGLLNNSISPAREKQIIGNMFQHHREQIERKYLILVLFKLCNAFPCCNVKEDSSVHILQLT